MGCLCNFPSGLSSILSLSGFLSASFFLCFPSLCFLSWQYLCVWLWRKCSRFLMWWINEKWRGDSAVSAHRPHLLSFLCSLYPSASLSLPLFALPLSISLRLSIEYALCSLCPSTSERICYLNCISTHQRRLFRAVDFHSGRFCWFDCTLMHRQAGIDGECHPAVKVQHLTGWCLRAYRLANKYKHLQPLHSECGCIQLILIPYSY